MPPFAIALAAPSREWDIMSAEPTIVPGPQPRPVVAPAALRLPLAAEQIEDADQPTLLVCIDNSDVSCAVVQHALGVARGLDLGVRLARVIETTRHLDAPVDPLEWQMRSGECRRTLERLARCGEAPAGALDSVLLAGPVVDELIRFAGDHQVPLLALAGRSRQEAGQAGLGHTARGLLERSPASVLIVPAHLRDNQPVRYTRLLVPLDGSLRAESVLPLASRIARTHGAEILLLHVLAKPDLVASPSLDPGIRDLCTRLSMHNERSARDYLDQLQRRTRKDGIATRSIVLTQGDPRIELMRIATDQQAGLIIMASHGCSGLSDVPCGSVTDYVASHAGVPVLVAKPSFTHGFPGHVPGDQSRADGPIMFAS